MRPKWLSLLVTALVFVVTAGVACGNGSTTTKSAALRVGDAAPAFTLPSAKGGTVSLAQFRGHRAVLLYFSMGPG